VQPETRVSAEREQVNCLYRIWEVLNRLDTDFEEAFTVVAKAIPVCVRFPDLCRVRVIYAGQTFAAEKAVETSWFYGQEIRVQNRAAGNILVYYTQEVPLVSGALFDDNERHLFEMIAVRLGHFIEHRELLRNLGHIPPKKKESTAQRPNDWRTLIALLRNTNLDLVFRLSHKMLVHLRLRGMAEADSIMERLGVHAEREDDDDATTAMMPVQRSREDTITFSEDVFRLASTSLSDDEVFTCLHRWMQEDKCSYFARTISNPDSTLRETIDAIRFLSHCAAQGVELSDWLLKAAHVHLIQRFLSDQLEFVKIAKDYIAKDDFYDLIRRMVYLQGSHGKLGAKGARLFLASHILQKKSGEHPELRKIKTPKSWYITTDCLFAFLCYNNLEDLMDQKYKKLDQVRQEYPLVAQFFRHAQFPPEIVRGLAMALDDFGDVPLVVRGSSLLEDQLGAEFSGKYVSRFIPPYGRKQERLKAVLDGIAEVYASVFAAEPIEFRAERGLIDFEEDVGVLIQEAVGMRVGRYFLPAFSGDAYGGAENIPGIRGESMLRLVFGLGTRMNARPEDDSSVQYTLSQSPRLLTILNIGKHAGDTAMMDVINLESAQIESLVVNDFLKSYGRKFVGIEQVMSSIRDGQTVPFSPLGFEYDKDQCLVTFDGMVRSTPLVQQIRTILDVLVKAFHTPLEIEFATNGHDLYLLECKGPRQGRTAKS